MIDILLVHPAAVHGIYGALGETLTAQENPLWPRLIAGYLLDRGWTVEICDMEAERLPSEGVIQRVIETGPRVVAICVYGHQPSASTQQMVGAHRLAECLREGKEGWEPWPVVVMLGNHPSALPVRTLEEEPIDYCIDGEGPVTLDGLLRIVSGRTVGGWTIADIPGLVWKKWNRADLGFKGGWTVAQNPRAPLLDLDRDLHGNAWHLLPPLSEYRAHVWQVLDGWPRSPYAAIYTSLGCSYRCDFCMINVFQHTNTYRRRDPAAVVREILHLYEEHNVRTLKIVDELYVLNRNHYRAVCEGIVALDIGDRINVWAYSRTDTLHVEDLPLLRAAGVRWLALGIESGSASIRGASQKALRGDKSMPTMVTGDDNFAIKETVRIIQAAGINVIGNYIFGLPDDTRETMQATLDLALELNTEWANFYCAMPYPGSPLYDHIVSERPQDLPPSWSAYSQHNRHCHPLRNSNLTAAEILKFRDDAFERYFRAPAYRQMLGSKFGADAVAQVDKMLEYQLERDLLK